MIKILVASKMEAQPLIDFYKLTPTSSFGLKRVYQCGQIMLVVSGMGMENARAVTRDLKNISIGRMSDDVGNDFWINFGLVGGGDFSVGDLVIAKKVELKNPLTCWSMDNVALEAVVQTNLVTISRPTDSYNIDEVYDMEAAGMMSALYNENVFDEKRLCENIFILKLVSDNAKFPASELTKQKMQKLLQSKTQSIYSTLKLITKKCITKC